MERVLTGGMMPLMLASVGVLVLYRVLARLRSVVSLQDAVVVITGASSGLGKGQAPLFVLRFSPLVGPFQVLACPIFKPINDLL